MTVSTKKPKLNETSKDSSWDKIQVSCLI